VKLPDGVHASIGVKCFSHFSQNFTFCHYPVLALMSSVATCLIALDGGTGNILDLR
jgi:hypothetical protein